LSLDNNLIATPGYQGTMGSQRIRDGLGRNGGMVRSWRFQGFCWSRSIFFAGILN